ncbi:MAG: AAA family ATPase, partial [Deltaproteobacteria bacterium]|nr:AAA family ATPase [Deltaproteobacteria bacterium]
ELREQCLFLHFDGARYCFKTTPNVTKLIEDESEGVSVAEIAGRIKEILEDRLAGRAAQIWPSKSQDVSDGEPAFQIVYLPLGFSDLNQAEQEKKAREFLEYYGDRPRRYRNAIGLAVPNRGQLEPLRRAVRYLLAIERIEKKKKQLGVTKEQADDLKERQGTEEAGQESALRQLYGAVWLAKSEGKGLEIEKVEIGGKPLQARGIHERLMELLTGSSQPKVFGTLHPKRIVELMHLGEGDPPKLAVTAKDLKDAFFGFVGYPRLTDESVLRKAIVRGVLDGTFGYYGHGELIKDPVGVYQIKREQVTIGKNLAEDEIDLSSGSILLPKAIPQEKELTLTPPEGQITPPEGPPVEGSQPPIGGAGPQIQRSVHLEFSADAAQLYKAWNAIGNLAEKAGTVKVEVDAQSEKGFDPNWLRNAVFEPLEEADLIKEKKKD